VNLNDNEKEREKSIGILKTVQVKSIDNRFAPLYYKRINFKLIKEAKTFNFSVYFAIMNLLNSMKIIYPSITLISLFVIEVSNCNQELYEDAKTSQKMESFLYLYEFLVFNLVEKLIYLKNYDRALYELMRILNPINDFNTLIYKCLLGVCLSHCFYYDAAIYNLCEGANLVSPLLTKYKSDTEEKIAKDKTKDSQPKINQMSNEGNIFL